MYAMIRVMGMFGEPPEELIAEAGLPPDHFEDLSPDRSIENFPAAQVWRVLEARQPDSAVGLRLGLMLDWQTYGPVSYVMRHCASMRKGLRAGAKYARVNASHIQMQLLDEADAVRPVYSHHPEIEALRHPIEAVMASIVVGLGRVRREGDILEASFKHAPTGPLAEYQKAFGVIPRFETEENALLIGHAILDRAPPEPDRMMFAMISDALDAALAQQVRRSDPAFVAALQSCVDACDYSVAALARNMGVFDRALHRRLATEGVSARSLLDEVRAENARALLKQPNLSIGDVAYLLGYSDDRSFIRAFKRWFDETPAQYRSA